MVGNWYIIRLTIPHKMIAAPSQNQILKCEGKRHWLTFNKCNSTHTRQKFYQKYDSKSNEKYFTALFKVLIVQREIAFDQLKLF